MEKSTVYFTDFRCPVGTSQLDKLKKLCIAAGIKDIDGREIRRNQNAFRRTRKHGVSSPELCESGCRSLQRAGRSSVSDRLQYAVSRQQKECAGTS